MTLPNSAFTGSSDFTLYYDTGFGIVIDESLPDTNVYNHNAAPTPITVPILGTIDLPTIWAPDKGDMAPNITVIILYHFMALQ